MLIRAGVAKNGDGTLKTSGRYYKYYLYNIEMEIYSLHAFFLAAAHDIEVISYVNLFIFILTGFNTKTRTLRQGENYGLFLIGLFQ